MLSSVDPEKFPSASSARMVEFDPWPDLGGRSLFRAVVRANRDFLRRHVNVLVAAVGLVLLLPVMLLIAAGIRLSSPGPILTKRTRVGLDRRSPYPDPMDWRRRVDYGGRLFTLYGFRTTPAVTSRLDARAVGKPEPTFPLGRLLRRSRLDRLPELFNVLKGDMNVVGPAPEDPARFARLRSQIGHYPYRQRVLPGMTGLAQIEEFGDTDPASLKRKVSLDLQYIDRRSAVEDLRILLRAAWAIGRKAFA